MKQTERTKRTILTTDDRTPGKKSQHTLSANELTWQAADALAKKLPNQPTTAKLFATLVNVARMTPEAFGLARPAGDLPTATWTAATQLAIANKMRIPKLFERLVSVVNLFPERFYVDKPEESVGQIIAGLGGGK